MSQPATQPTPSRFVRITAPVGPSAAEWIMNAPYRVAIGSTWQYVATWPEAVEVAEYHGVEVELSPRHALEHPVMVDPYERAPVMRGPTAGQVAIAEVYQSSSGEE